MVIKIHSSHWHQVHCGITWQHWCTISGSLDTWRNSSVPVGFHPAFPWSQKRSNYTGNLWHRYLSTSPFHLRTRCMLKQKEGFNGFRKTPQANETSNLLKKKAKKRQKLYIACCFLNKFTSSHLGHPITPNKSQRNTEVQEKQIEIHVVPGIFNQAKGYN